MKAISEKQPWASLIVHGIKDIENRTWPCPKKYIGKRVLIHSSSCSWTWHRVLNYMTKPMLAIFEKLGYNGKWVRCQPTGAIIGSVEIVDCVINHPSIWAEKTITEQMECPKCGCDRSEYYGDGEHKCDRCDHIWFENENKPIYNWVLANPILFPEPIPAKGKLSFWEFDRIQEPQSDGEHDICMCRICVDERSQVMSMGNYFVCRYCGGRWYK